MRVSKLRLLAICLIVLLISPLSAQLSPLSASDCRPDYGIDLDASYPGTTVQELLEAAEAEATHAIEEAYAEGYKAGLLDTAPDRDYWKSMAEDLARKADAKQAKIFFLGVSIGVGVTACTSLIVYLTQR
jgi:hypothetical protein